jgi:hypothetical protein
MCGIELTPAEVAILWQDVVFLFATAFVGRLIVVFILTAGHDKPYGD